MAHWKSSCRGRFSPNTVNKTTFGSNVRKFSTRVNSQSLSHAQKYVFMQINLKVTKHRIFPQPVFFFLNPHVISLIHWKNTPWGEGRQRWKRLPGNPKRFGCEGPKPQLLVGHPIYMLNPFPPYPSPHQALAPATQRLSPPTTWAPSGCPPPRPESPDTPGRH